MTKFVLNSNLVGELLYSAEYKAIRDYTIPDVDFRGYRYIRILFAPSGTNRMVFTDVYIDENAVGFPLVFDNFPGGVYHKYVRSMSVSNGTLTIGVARDYSILAGTSTEKDNYCVPIKIWGFK